MKNLVIQLLTNKLRIALENWKKKNSDTYGERPKCRLVINNLLENGYRLEELVLGKYKAKDSGKTVLLTSGLRIQARKMFLELMEQQMY
jgi:hypothetical protein